MKEKLPLFKSKTPIGFFFIFLLFFSCKKDENIEHSLPKQDITALKQWFVNQEPILQTETNWLNTLKPDWDRVNTINGNDSLKVYEVSLLNPNKIFVLTKNITVDKAENQLSGNTEFRLIIFENLITKKHEACIMELVSYESNSILDKVHYKDYKDLSGVINFHELNGKFSNGYIINKGIITREASLSNKVDFNMLEIGKNTTGGNGKIMLVDAGSMACGRALVPHVRTVCIGTGGLDGWGYDGSGGGVNCRQETYYVSEVQYCQIPEGEDPDGSYTGGGGGGNGSTGPGSNTNSNPDCAKVKAQSSSTAYKEKVEDLKGKTNLKKETGLEEKKDGSFNTLTNDGNNSMNAVPLGDTKGFMHTHVNDYYTSESDGTLTKNSPIRMFSPADVNILMGIVNKNRTSGNYLEYYVSMISSNGNYMIKFTGAESDLKMGFHTQEWDDSYKDFMTGYINLEKGFLRFLNDKMGVKGVKLYKIENNGNIKTIELKPDGKTLDKKDC